MNTDIFPADFGLKPCVLIDTREQTPLRMKISP